MEQIKTRGPVKYRNVSVSEFGFLSLTPLLCAACSITSGPIIELGGGFGSTLVLHGICGSTNREVLTLEHDSGWMSWLGLYGRTWHKFKQVSTFIDLPEYTERDWGLAVVDHGIFGERGIALSGVSHVPIIVAHDTCHEALNYTNDGAPQVLDSFKYRYDLQWSGPQTSALSNVIDVKEEFGRMKL